MTQITLSKSDEARLVISSGLIAVAVGVFTLLPSSYLINIIKITFGFSAFFSFLYILLTAAKLKYREPGQIDLYNFTEKFRHKTYDISVDIYGPNLSLITMLGIALLLGWNPTTLPDWRLAIGAVITFPLMLLLLGIFGRKKK